MRGQLLTGVQRWANNKEPGVYPGLFLREIRAPLSGVLNSATLTTENVRGIFMVYFVESAHPKQATKETATRFHT